MAKPNTSFIFGQGGSYTSNVQNFPSGTATTSNFKGVCSLCIDKVRHLQFVGDKNNARIQVYVLDSSNRPISDVATYTISMSGVAFLPNLSMDELNERLFVSTGGVEVVCLNVSLATLAAGSTAVIVGRLGNGATDASKTNSGIDDIDYDPNNQRLFVTCTNACMEFPVPLGFSNHPDAVRIWGQSSFAIPRGAACTRAGMNNQGAGVCYDRDEKVVMVADINNMRILGYDATPGGTGAGANALWVLGPNDFTTVGSDTVSQTACGKIDDMCFDHKTRQLWGAQLSHNALIVFNIPIGGPVNGAAAANRVGQNDYTSITAEVSQSGGNASEPASGCFDETNRLLYIYDLIGNRVRLLELLRITTSSLPNCSQGVAYSQTVAIANNQGASQSYSIYSGTLPAGLSINSSTGEISGTPADANQSTFTVEVRDNFTGTGYFPDRKAYTLGSLFQAPNRKSLFMSRAHRVGWLSRGLI